MIAIIATLLANPYVQGILVGGVMWTGGKIAKLLGDNKAGKLATLLTTCTSLMAQYVWSEPNKTPEQVIVACRGICAIQFAKAGYDERQRGLVQPLIDKAIASAVEQWVKLHPEPSSLTMPITRQVDASAK